LARRDGAPVGVEDEDPAGADPVGVLELALEAAAGEVDLDRDPRVAQFGRQRHRPLPLARVGDGDEGVAPLPRHLFVQRQQDPLDPGGEPDRGGRRPAELLDQAVVAAAAADLRLRPEPVADEGEDRPRVVVEAADQVRVDDVGDAGGVEQRPHLGEVLGVLPLQPLDDRRRARHHAPRPLIVGVEGAQRVDVDPLAHVPGELALVRVQVRFQVLQVGAPRLERAEAAEPQLHARHAQLAQQVGEEHDHLGVGERRVGADALDPELVELAVAAGLRSLVAEERPEVVELHRLRQFLHPMLKVGATDRGGPLRPQGQAAPTLVLADDVGGPADAALEEVGVLEGGRRDRLVAGAGEDGRRCGFEPAPGAGGLGEDVEGPARGLELARHGAS
jgi:hypothetical protein